MTFQSVLNISSAAGVSTEASDAPPYLVDLNLDQIFRSVTSDKEEYNLLPFFYAPLKSREAIESRQAVMRDLENSPQMSAVNQFANAMRAVRQNLAQSEKLYYKYQKEACLLDSVEQYCAAVEALNTCFRSAPPKSVGLRDFARYLEEYIQSPPFRKLSNNTVALKAKLLSIRYSLVIGPGVIVVSTYNDEPDYGAELQADFEKFKQGSASDHIFKVNNYIQMNHIEAGVIDRLALIYKDQFSELDEFATRNSAFIDSTIERFDREIQFYVAYVEYIIRLRNAGVKFCYPQISINNKDIVVDETCDLALANKLLDSHNDIVTNDFFLSGRERILIVSGPNQGGKTTFARTFGQLHYLASLGYPVPGARAQLVQFDRIYTHFEKQEDVHNLRGKLRDDLFRLHETLTTATPRSIIILNEVFNSTSLKDAIFLSTKVLTKIIELDAICVCVTFIDELAALSDTTVSMASNVNPDNVAERTFKIVRRPPDGLAYAISIAEKYRLTYPQLRDRLAS